MTRETQFWELAAPLERVPAVRRSTMTGLPSIGDWAVAVVAILLARPAAMLLSLLRTTLPRHERYVAAWFGP